MASAPSRLSKFWGVFSSRTHAAPKDLELLVTLWPSFPHFARFAKDPRLAGIRLNSAQMSHPELEHELEVIESTEVTVPMFFDVKGRQPRVVEAHEFKDHLELTLNHRIRVDLAEPQPVLFKAGGDDAPLVALKEDGQRLVFAGGPRFRVKAGESLHIRHPSFEILGPIFTDVEREKIERVRKAGFKRYFLSYVECQQDVDEFQELVGRDSEVWLKIENQKGLDFVATEFRKTANLTLVAARGDLYIEIGRPHEILGGVKMIIEKDPQACVGSRLLLSVMQEAMIRAYIQLRGLKAKARMLDFDKFMREYERVVEQGERTDVPSCADWHELAWLYDIGYRRMMLCDELCLKEHLLAPTVNAFEGFRQSYAKSAAASAA